MSNGTALLSGAYIEFQAAVLKALPRDINDEAALDWANNGEKLTNFLSGLVNKGEKREKPKSTEPILHLLSDGEIILPETDSKRTLAKAKDTFPGFLDSDFKNWGTDVVGEKSGEMPVSIYEIRQNATFSDMFTLLSSDLDKLAMPQDKIIEFCENHQDHLREGGHATFFLFKVGDKFFVANVNFENGGRLMANVNRFGSNFVWGGGFRRRVIVPQL